MSWIKILDSHYRALWNTYLLEQQKEAKNEHKRTRQLLLEQ